jgi:DNA-binding Lrp family transcriptional regulator
MSKSAGNNRKVDRLDMRILTALADRSRQTITELAKNVGLSASPCAARLERLENDQIIMGYHAEVDVESLADLSLYYVTIAGKPYTPGLARKLESLMIANPYIVSAEALFGSLDYILRVYARSAQHYHEIMAPFAEHQIDYETWPVSRCVVRPHLRRLVAELRRLQE